MKITAGSGEQNTGTLKYEKGTKEGEGTYVVADTTAPVVPGTGCVADGPNAVRCEKPQATQKVLRTEGGISINLGDGDDSWTADIGGTVDAGPGNDVVNSSPSYVHGGTGNDTLTAYQMYGEAGDDILNGVTIGSVGSVLDGGAGNDVLKGAGNDTVKNSGVDDMLIPGQGDDTVDGGGGNDTLSYEKRVGPVTVDLSSTSGSAGVTGEHDTISGVENVVGTSSADTLTGNDTANAIDGHGGADRIDARGGNDKIEYVSIGARVRAGAGNDFIGSLTRDTDCGPGKDIFVPFYPYALSLGRVRGGCELAQIAPPGATDGDNMLIKAGSVRVRRSRIELDIIGQGALDSMGITLVSRGKRIAFARRVKLKSSQTGRTNRVRIPLTAAGKRRFQTTRQVTARLTFRSEFSSQDQLVKIER